MAKVQAQVVGGSIQSVEGVTMVQDVMTKLGLVNHSASVNGDAVAVNYELSDYEYVSLAPNVKGAAKKAATKTKTVLKKGPKNK